MYTVMCVMRGVEINSLSPGMGEQIGYVANFRKTARSSASTAGYVQSRTGTYESHHAHQVRSRDLDQGCTNGFAIRC